MSSNLDAFDLATSWIVRYKWDEAIRSDLVRLIKERDQAIIETCAKAAERHCQEACLFAQGPEPVLKVIEKAR